MLKRFAPLALHNSPSATPDLPADKAIETDGASDASRIARQAIHAA